MYAVIDLQWHQYIVKKWDKITVDKIEPTSGKKKVLADKVLLVFDEDGKDVKIWKPYIDKATVECEILETKKGPKLKVVKYKIKNRYSRTMGFRPIQSTLKIKDITLDA
jgi:large subunit ribosomal protein L21